MAGVRNLKDRAMSCLFDEDIPIQGRLFSAMVLIGLFAGGAAFLLHSLIDPDPIIFVVMVFGGLVLVGSFIYANHSGQFLRAIYISIILVFDIAYPLNFFFWGGLHSGMIVFFALTIVLIFLLLSGWHLFWMVLLNLTITITCYVLEFNFPWLVQQLPLPHQFIDAIGSLTFSAIFVGLLLRFMTRSYAASQARAVFCTDSIERKNTLLEVGDHMSSILLTSDIDDFGQGLKMALENLGAAIHVDQITIFKAQFDEDGCPTTMENEFIWTKADLPETRANDFNTQANAPNLNDLMPRWQAGETTFRSTSAEFDDSTDPFIGFLKTHGIKSLTTIPIMVDRAFWGTVTFDNYSSESSFSDEELRILRSSSHMIVNSIIRMDMIKEFRDAKDAALAGTQAKGDFLSNMSHEIRTPLNAIISMTKLARFERDAEKVSNYIGRVERASDHLLGLINDILDMSKIEAGALELACMPFSLRETISHVLSIMTFRAKDRSQSLESTIDVALPDFYAGDDQRISQILMNLLGNAVKFTPEGGSIFLTVRLATDDDLATSRQILGRKEHPGDSVCLDPTGATLCFSVRDTGVGISKEAQERIFEVFRQAENNTTRTYGGTGLGLAISRTLVETMGGAIWVNSAPDQGAEFTFTLVLPEASSDDLPSLRPSRSTLIEKIDLNGKRLLVAEDFEINQEILAAVLEGTGIEIVFAANGQLAVEAFESSNGGFDMILMDIQMPVMDGYEATRAIRNLWYDNAQTIPIIAQTANVFREDIEKAFASGMNDHLGKPINFDELINKMRQYLS